MPHLCEWKRNTTNLVHNGVRWSSSHDLGTDAKITIFASQTNVSGRSTGQCAFLWWLSQKPRCSNRQMLYVFQKKSISIARITVQIMLCGETIATFGHSFLDLFIHFKWIICSFSRKPTRTLQTYARNLVRLNLPRQGHRSIRRWLTNMFANRFQASSTNNKIHIEIRQNSTNS